MQRLGILLRSPSSKKYKNPSGKNFLYFAKWNFLVSPKISQKSFSYISGKWNFLALRLKEFLYF